MTFTTVVGLSGFSCHGCHGCIPACACVRVDVCIVCMHPKEGEEWGERRILITR